MVITNRQQKFHKYLIAMDSKSSIVNLWKKAKTNSTSKRKRRVAVAKMLSARSSREKQQKHEINSHSTQMELHLDNVSIVNNSISEPGNDCENSIVQSESECEIPNSWQNELDDDFANSSIEELAEDQNLIFVQELAHWSVKHSIRRDALDDLMVLLNGANPKMNLPKHSRTILRTPREKAVIAQDGFGGEYWHYGLEKALICCLKNLRHYPIVNININIDGLPLFESSKVEFWPILFNIHEITRLPPMIVGIYSGKGEFQSVSVLIH